MTVARTVPQARGALGGILQFCGCLLLGNSRRQNHRTRNDPGFRSHAICGDRWVGGSNRVGPSDLVVGTAHFFLACIDRWLRGCGHHALRVRSDHPCRLVQNSAFYFCCPADGSGTRLFLYGRHFLAAAAYSIGHGGNDAQKTMGIIATALFGSGYLTRSELAGSWGRFHWPIILAAQTSIALGTYFGG